jgi:hypothetical protein
MPSFGKNQMLDSHSIGLIADWLRGEWIDSKPPDALVTESK